ncbi:uncharacterized protein LOC111275279 isoform X2 [Durio zibethinus]|uniref:Uncharacterized protein LOC111275279 isoform X2 n=1 Tax=Durio zibethinus TaxID=66656 RepID=A0A6P5WL96_DURZI|nr:uncharacterized protein LOC111275279 isoform X2 [Durio zibethinus]
MSENDYNFVGWEEHIICQERGNRVVHFYLKEASGILVLAVVGTERSIRHMMYVVSGEFVQAYGIHGFINANTKWRARREVVEWLQSLVSMNRPPADFQMDDSIRGFGPVEVSTTGPIGCQTCLPHQMVLRKLKAQNSDIVWYGIAWICAKQLKHYPSFCRNGTIITVHSFVFIMAEESHYLGYLEDMYEDKKGQKKVKVRWFHHNREVKGVICQLNHHPREVFITPHVQVISAECVDGLATVLTPRHYEKCLAIVPQTSQLAVYMCFRHFKNNKVKPFTLTKLRGYSNQAILSSLDGPLVPKQKGKNHKSHEEDEGALTFNDPVRVTGKRNKSYKEQDGLESGSGGRNTVPVNGNQIMNCQPSYPKLKLRFSRKTMGIASQLQSPLSFNADEKIELLCQDSGIRGCWFRCKVLKASQTHLKVQYDDVQDVDGSGNLQEWVPNSRVATPDKLGMRCPGRLTIRPCPPKDNTTTDRKFEIGAPIDVWWSDGWWEGVTTGVGISGDDDLQVYLPGENKFLTVQRENTRTSKDWVDDRWVNINGRPDILSYLSPDISPSMNPSTCMAMVEASGCSSIATMEHKVLKTLKLEVVKEELELPNPASHDGPRDMNAMRVEKRPDDNDKR